MRQHRLTYEQLVRLYLRRIEAYDRAGPKLNSIRHLNPKAIEIAKERDRHRAGHHGPLYGIPVLLKDNIDTADEPTTAGSVALANSMPPRDAFITRKLREAGAVIIGKANLTEFANYLANNMPSGYSSLGGYVLNPYNTAPAANGDGRPELSPGGSSAGPGSAVAANLVTVAIGSRDVGIDPQPVEPEFDRRHQADRRADQPHRHHSDRRQPGYRRSDGAHRHRRGDPARRADRARSRRSGDGPWRASVRLHRVPDPRRPQGRPHRRAARGLLGQPQGRPEEDPGERHRRDARPGRRGDRRRDSVGQGAKCFQIWRSPLRIQARPESLPEHAEAGLPDPDAGRRDRVQHQGERAEVRPGAGDGFGRHGPGGGQSGVPGAIAPRICGYRATKVSTW